jgi:hypothetical protein
MDRLQNYIYSALTGADSKRFSDRNLSLEPTGL